MNEKELNEIKARCEAATPGPWVGDRNDGTIKYKMLGGLDGNAEVLVVDHKNGDSGFYCGDGTYEECEANEEFVKHARTDVPALVAEVERLNWIKIEYQRLRESVQSIIDLDVRTQPGSWADTVKQIKRDLQQALKGSLQ